MSNDPDYTWHLRNLNNFVNLSPRWPVSHAMPRPAAAFRRAQPPLGTRESAGVQPHACARQPARLRHAEDRNRNRNAAVIVGATLHVATSCVARCALHVSAAHGARWASRVCAFVWCPTAAGSERRGDGRLGDRLGAAGRRPRRASLPRQCDVQSLVQRGAQRGAQRATDDGRYAMARERALRFGQPSRRATDWDCPGQVRTCLACLPTTARPAGTYVGR
jgi:hypothetical protein